MSNKFLEECLIEFRHLLKEWRDEIAVRREQQLVSLSSSPNILGDNNSIDPHDSIAISENPSTIQTSIKPPRTTSSPRPCQPEILIASSHKPVNVTTSPPTVNLSHKSPTETQTPKTTTKNNSTGYVFNNPLEPPKIPAQPSSKIPPKIQRNRTSQPKPTKQTQTPIKTQIPHLIPHHVPVSKQRPNKQMQQQRLAKNKENPPTKRPPRKRWKRLLHCPRPRCIPKHRLCRTSSAPGSVVTQLDRAIDSQSSMFRVLWFRRRKKKKLLLFGWFKKRKKKKKKKKIVLREDRPI
jgi:hypothetical protein